MEKVFSRTLKRGVEYLILLGPIPSHQNDANGGGLFPILNILMVTIGLRQKYMEPRVEAELLGECDVPFFFLLSMSFQ